MDLDKERRIYGKLGNVSLVDIIQLLGMTKRTATLVLEREGRRGKIFFKDGKVLHAFAGEESEGEEAVLHLLEWVDADFVIEEGIATLPKVTISKDTEALMLSAFTKLDETRKEFLAKTHPLDLESATKEIGLTPGFGETVKIEEIDKETVEETKGEEGVSDSPVSMVGGGEKKKPIIPVIVISIFAVVLGLLFYSKFFGKKAETSAKRLPAKASVGMGVPKPTGVKNEVPSTSVSPTTTTIEAIPPAEKIPPKMAVVKKTSPVSKPKPPGFGYLLVIVNPWAEVTIDGKKVGETPMGKIKLTEGEHTITLSNPNFVGVITDKIRISNGSSITKRYTFNNFGYLQIVVTPWAEVYIDGKHIGQTPMKRMKLPVGRHTVILRNPSLGEKRREVEIKANQTFLLKITM